MTKWMIPMACAVLLSACAGTTGGSSGEMKENSSGAGTSSSSGTSGGSTATRYLADRKFAFGAGEATIIFFHHAAAVRAGCLERCVVTGDGVVVIFFRALDDDLRHLRNFAHELFATDLATFHLRELEFPSTCQLGRGEFRHTEAA